MAGDFPIFDAVAAGRPWRRVGGGLRFASGAGWQGCGGGQYAADRGRYDCAAIPFRRKVAAAAGSNGGADALADAYGYPHSRCDYLATA